MKALALYSGGLDSLLAMKVVKDQGIKVVAINVNIGFGSTTDRSEYMKNMCDQIGVELQILDLRELYLDEVLFDPKYGYGKNFNPCIDCHGFMFRHTGKLLEKFNADFMISGEVLGQRPKSQRKEALTQVKELSDYDDLIVRPLCAKLLEPSLPEREGWIDREKLLDINGRNRQRQLNMAKEIGLQNFESPGGGCLLTDEQFSNRLRDFVDHDELKVEDIDSLKAGRHLRLPDGAKLIIGRHKEDNEKLQAITSKKYYHIRLQDATGPYSLIDKKASKEEMQLAAQFIISYGKTELDKTYSVKFFDEDTQIDIKGKKLPTKDSITQYFVK